MNTTDDVIGILHKRIEALESKFEVLCAMLDGRSETDAQWRNAIEDKLDRLGEPVRWSSTKGYGGRIG